MEVSELRHNPTVLVILDGWGVATPSRGNAISEAKTPHMDHFIASYPVMTLQASGEAAGLPWAEVGNSEVGHMNIGAGRVIRQELTRLNQDIREGTFFTNPAILDAVNYAKSHTNTVHLVGMVSSGGVHSHIDHLIALLELMRTEHIEHVFIHAILDGRDAPYSSGLSFITKIEEKIQELGIGQIASISGRFYAMDRDNHWDRIEKAYNAMVLGKSERTFESATTSVDEAYHNSMFDEEVVPTVIVKDKKPVATINKGDTVILFNFRADRMRELTRALSLPVFTDFSRPDLSELFVCTLTQYEKGLPVHVVYAPTPIKNCLAEVISNQGLPQLHIAETEKYAHITYFLNGGNETPFAGEKRILIPSQRVESHAQKPEMSAREITDEIVNAIKSGEYPFIAVNFANPDMVAHTGQLKESIKAIEVTDECLGRIASAVIPRGGAMIITADHGNAEVVMNLQTGDIDKEHNPNPVPFILIAPDLEGTSIGNIDIPGNDLSVVEASGILSDVAPTVLDIMGIPKPPEMTGSSLLSL